MLGVWAAFCPTCPQACLSQTLLQSLAQPGVEVNFSHPRRAEHARDCLQFRVQKEGEGHSLLRHPLQLNDDVIAYVNGRDALGRHGNELVQLSEQKDHRTETGTAGIVTRE